MKTHYFTEPIPKFIKNEIEQELKKNLPEYDFIEAHYKSAYKDDEYLYLVLASSKSIKDLFSFWTYNTTVKAFYHGHYNFRGKNFALNVMETYFFE